MSDLTAEELAALGGWVEDDACVPKPLRERLWEQARRCAEAEQCAQRLWLRDAATGRLLTLRADHEFDLSHARRLLGRVPLPVDVKTEMGFGDAGVTIAPAAGERLLGFVDELVDLLRADKPVLTRHAREAEEAPNAP